METKKEKKKEKTGNIIKVVSKRTMYTKYPEGNTIPKILGTFLGMFL